MARDPEGDTDMDDMPLQSREVRVQDPNAAQDSEDSPHEASLLAPAAVSIRGRDSSIKCLCTSGAARLPEDIVLTGAADGKLTWMHLPCKALLYNLSPEAQSKMNNCVQSAKDVAQTGGTEELHDLVLGTLGSTGTEEQKRYVKHFTSKYRCDGPCGGSEDIKDYFCCKKCWAWQHSPCMLFGEEDRGAPVCNHCYMNFLVHRDELIAWQKKRLAQAALEALKYMKNSDNKHEVERMAWCRKLVAGFMFKNRSNFFRFVIARRRVEQLLRVSRTAKKNVQDAASRRQDSLDANTKSTTEAITKVKESAPSKRAIRTTSKRISMKEETDSEVDGSMNVDGPESFDATLPPVEGDESDTIVVKPKKSTTAPKAIRPFDVSKKKETTPQLSRPTEKESAGVSATKGRRASKKKPSTSEKANEASELPAPFQKRFEFSQGQMSSTARKSVRKDDQPSPADSNAELDGWEDEDFAAEPEKAPTRRGGRKPGRTPLDEELARRILTEQFDRIPMDESDNGDEQMEPTPKRRKSNKGAAPEAEEEDDGDHEGSAISCRCVDADATRADSFECSTCGMWQHLKCARRDALELPRCNFCDTRAVSSASAQPNEASTQMPKPAEAACSPRQPKAKGQGKGKGKANVASVSSKAQRTQSQKVPEEPPPKQKAAETRKPHPTPSPKAAPTLAPASSTKTAPSSVPRTPLSPEMKDEVNQLCSTILWRTYCEIPMLLEDDEDMKSADGSATPPPPAPSADWLAETQKRLTDMLEVFGPHQTQAYLDPVLSTFPRKKENIIKTLREMAVEMVHRGAYKRQGKKALGVLAEVLALEDKGKFWKG